MTAPPPSVWPSLILLGALHQHAGMMEQLRGWVGGSNGLFDALIEMHGKAIKNRSRQVRQRTQRPPEVFTDAGDD